MCRLLFYLSLSLSLPPGRSLASRRRDRWRVGAFAAAVGCQFLFVAFSVFKAARSAVLSTRAAIIYLYILFFYTY